MISILSFSEHQLTYFGKMIDILSFLPAGFGRPEKGTWTTSPHIQTKTYSNRQSVAVPARHDQRERHVHCGRRQRTTGHHRRPLGHRNWEQESEYNVLHMPVIPLLLSHFDHGCSYTLVYTGDLFLHTPPAGIEPGYIPDGKRSRPSVLAMGNNGSLSGMYVGY